MATLYAEILMNIQQATVTATIPGYSIVPQKAWMSDDRRVFYFSHDGKPISVSLPCEIVENVNISSELSTWRLPLKKNCSIHLSTDPNGDPWAASSLTKDTLIACGYCNTPILSESPIWKDLPSESWAEMMDFWHCHKPETKELGKSQPSGYSAGESIKCSSGVAFVDERHIIMARADCNLHVDQRGLAECCQCVRALGIWDGDMEGVKLWKWTLAIAKSSTTGKSLLPTWEVYPFQKFMSLWLLSLIESQATRKFLIYVELKGETEELEQEGLDSIQRLERRTIKHQKLENLNHQKAIMLWVFIPCLQYSWSSKGRGKSSLAMKVLYQEVEKPPDLAQPNPNLEVLSVHPSFQHELEADLQASTAMIPEEFRKFGDWNVGLLDRFPKQDSP